MEIGLCVAQATEGGTLDTFTPENSTIQPNSIGVLEQYSPVQSGILVGATFDFTIETTGTSMDYIIRSVVCQTGESVTSQTGNPISLNQGGGGYRGAWSQSNVNVANDQTPFDVTSGQMMMIWLAEANSVDKLPFKEDPNDPDDTDNGGNYGVHTSVTIWAKNPSDQDKTMRVRIAALVVDPNVPTPYFGSTDVGYRVGPIRRTNGTPDNVAFVRDFQVLKNTVSGKPFGMIPIMHAGGAWLPVGILLTTVP